MGPDLVEAVMNRTKKGNVTAKARDKHGDENGKYPVFDQKSAMSAIKLRHHGKGVSPSSVLAKVSRWANANNNDTVKNALKKAREVDKS